MATVTTLDTAAREAAAGLRAVLAEFPADGTPADTRARHQLAASVATLDVLTVRRPARRKDQADAGSR